MNRQAEFKKLQRPTNIFMEWSSTENCLRYWNKEKSQNVNINIPFKFLKIKHYYTLKGWSEQLGGSLIANEVEDLRTEQITLKLYRKESEKPEILKSGLYQDIKDYASNKGAKFTLSIYGITEKGDVVNIQAKGSGLGNLFDILNKQELFDHYLVAGKSLPKKKGATKYNELQWEVGEMATDDVLAKANETYDKLIAYYNQYKQENKKISDKKTEAPKTKELDDLPEIDDLPF